MPLHICRHFRIQNSRHELLCKIDDRNAHALGLQVFRHFQADKTTPDDHCPLDVFRLHICPNRDGIFRRAHFIDSILLYAGNGRQNRARTRGDDECVIVQFLLLGPGKIAHQHFLVAAIQRNGLHARLHADTRQIRIFFGRVDDEFDRILNRPAHIIGQCTARIGNLLIPGDQRNLRVSIFPFELGSRFCPGRNSANDEYFFLHFLPLFYACSCLWQQCASPAHSGFKAAHTNTSPPEMRICLPLTSASAIFWRTVSYMRVTVGRETCIFFARSSCVSFA